jgi:hypothetical protein
MSLTSLREDGLFTGEEVTIKFGPGEERILAVLVETDENTDEENSMIADFATVVSHSHAEPQLSLHETDLSAADATTKIDENGDEGVNAILIEHGTPIPVEEEHVGHYITPQQPEQLPPICPPVSKTRFSFKRKITMKMNQAASKVKSVLGTKSGGTFNTSSTAGTTESDSDECMHALLPTPRAAQSIEESASHFKETQSPTSALVSNDNSTDQTTRLSNNNIEQSTSSDFDTIAKDEYDKSSPQASTPTICNAETNDASIEYDIIHTSQLESPPSKEIEQFDPTYQGPYDDNKSFVTYSTGDFDMSQMYSRSWSTIAPTVVSKRRFGRSCSGKSLISRNERVVVMSELYGNALEEGSEEIVVPMPTEGGSVTRVEKEDGVSLDGLSLVNSVVGDDRSYVEDY